MTNPTTSIQIEVNEIIPSDVSFNLKAYISKILSLCQIKQGSFEFTFCDNEKICQINKDYLNRSYATDIISFNFINSLMTLCVLFTVFTGIHYLVINYSKVR